MWVKHIECVGEISNLYSSFGRHEEKRRRRKRKDAVKSQIEEMGCALVCWIQLPRGLHHRQTFANNVMSFSSTHKHG